MKTQRLAIQFFIAILTLFVSTHIVFGNKITKEQSQFCNQHFPAVVQLYKTQGNDAALKLLEKKYQLAEQQFSNTHFFFSKIWLEAQTLTGNRDEEWGLALYLFLLDREHRLHPKTITQIPGDDYLLYGNIIECYQDLGKIAQARTFVMRLEDSQRTQKGMDTRCSSYTDIGSIFSFLPDARKRNFPIYEHELSNRCREMSYKTRMDYIYYSYIYGIGYAADSAESIGNWSHSAELSYWLIRYTDEYMKQNNYRKNEVGNHSLEESRRLARIAMMHGYPEEAVRLLNEIIAKGEGYYHTKPIFVYRAKLDLILAKIAMGEKPEDALAVADKAAELAPTHFYYSRRTQTIMTILDKVRVYHAMGHAEEAWEIVNDLFAQTAKDVNPYLEILTVNAAIDLAVAEGCMHPELEGWLVRALDHERQMGNKFKELPLYEKYAQFLMAQGRFAEAEQIQLEAIRLSKAMNLPKRLETNLGVLASMKNTQRENAVATVTHQETPLQKTTEVSQPADENTTESFQSILSAVDVQPRLSLSAALEGQAAYGRFYIHNPSTRPQQGELVLSGPIDQPKWQQEQWLTVGSSPEFSTTELRQAVTLNAGESCIVDITGLPSKDGSGTQVQCRWIPQGQQQSNILGHWKYQTSATGKRTAVIDAHEFQSNPFYLIPIHHMIQRCEIGNRQTVDISIEASVPMRIESYDAATGELLAIDANGDGDFLDKGDFISSDQNRNSWPDLTFEKDQRLASLVLYVKSLGNAPKEIEQELTVKLLINDEWQVDATDVIKPTS